LNPRWAFTSVRPYKLNQKVTSVGRTILESAGNILTLKL